MKKVLTSVPPVLALILTLSLGRAAQAVSPVTCSIQSFDGHYVTVVDGGGRIKDVIHTNANRVGAWERITIIPSNEGGSVFKFGFRTVKGDFLTAVGGGGRTDDVIHSDATQMKSWEKFSLISLGGDIYAIQTMSGNYLTAQDSGGRTDDVIHSNARKIGAWEKFRFNCRL